MASNENKTKVLGMPFGTANGRLRKNIMFKYVVLAGHNFCFACGAEIESVDDLSIEHKLPWETVKSPELFWDLDNIAFSHIACNRPHTKTKPWVNTIEGKRRCRVCKEYKELPEFYKSSTDASGRQSHCKDCGKLWRTGYKKE